MNTTTTTDYGRNGSILLLAMTMLAIAAITGGSILTASISYSRQSESSFARERAALLADAGIGAAIVELNHAGDGSIEFDESRAYFTQTQSFTADDWGFQTRRDGYHVTSIGQYAGSRVTVETGLLTNSAVGAIHALYLHALYAGVSSHNTNYVLDVGGTDTGADFVGGDTYSGNRIALSGSARLRLPELIVDTNANGILDLDEAWTNAYTLQTFTNPVPLADFIAYTNAMGPNMSNVYANGRYDMGEAFVDSNNGKYDLWEPFTDINGNGKRDAGDSFIDKNANGQYDVGIDTVVDKGNGKWDPGEEWTEDNNSTRRPYRGSNGRYDKAGGYWKNGTWTNKYGSNKSCSSWPYESFVDSGDGVYTAEEPYVDGNGVYDPGELYLDDRNSEYDYGTQATSDITGMPAPGPGQKAATGHDAAIDPPDLASMHYDSPKTGSKPSGAMERWGHDVLVSAAAYAGATTITDTNKPAHIFARNPTGRGITTTKTTNNVAIDDYFLEDASQGSAKAPAICANDDVYNNAGTLYSGVTEANYINVLPKDNNKVYFVDGNLYIHNPSFFSFRFKNPGTRITIVARGNITISDEFYYNANYPTGTQQIAYQDFNSSKVINPKDALCLIALKNPNQPTNSGIIKIGDPTYGTGGSIHAMLYAENNFVDNNLDTGAQNYISVFGNMTAGNQIDLHRSGASRTRLDVTLDDRIRRGVMVDGDPIVPGLPYPVANQRGKRGTVAKWSSEPGTWSSWSRLK